MQINKKNDIDFITDLVWHKSTENNKVSLKQYKKECQFNYYCKTVAISSLYGFMRSDGINLKNPVSLALYILESLEIESGDDSVFLCFNFHEKNSDGDNLYGYILFYRGAILPERGEYIGKADQVQLEMSNLAKRYGIKIAKIFDDVPFYNNQHFILESELSVTPIASYHVYDKDNPSKILETIPASEYYLWSTNRKENLKKKARLEPLVTISATHKKQIALLGIVLISLLGFSIKEIYFTNDDFSEITQTIVSPLIVTAVAADKMINACFEDIDKLIVAKNGWELSSFKCDLVTNGYDVIYKSQDGNKQDLLSSVNEPGLKFIDGGAKLHKTIDITKTISTSNMLLSTQVDYIKDIAKKLDFKITINNGNHVETSITSKQNIEINSRYSPLFLYENDVLTNVNIAEINMQPQDGFYQWTIKGELNGI